MELELKGKKILILGATEPICQIVHEAHSMGMDVYVADYLEDSPAKKIADHKVLLNAVDVNAIVDFCKREKIDGLFTGYNDMLLPYCQKACEILGKPFCGDEENIRMSIDKTLFKQACERSGVPVVPWVQVEKEYTINDISKIIPPVVVKPADYSGSKGVYKCYEKAEIKKYIDLAMSMSKSGKVLVEKVMNPENEFSVYYMFYNGNYYLTAMGDRYINVIDPNIAPVGRGMIYPSIFLNEWKTKMDASVRKFFRNNDMKNGFAFLQGFYEDGEFYIHEMGYRLNGGFTYDIVEHFSGYHQMQQLLKFAISGEMDQELLEQSDADYPGFGMIITISLKPGKISEIKGIDEIKDTPGVLRFHALHKIGDELKHHGTTAQVFAYILCGVPNKEKLEHILKIVKEKLVVNDTFGKSMIRETILPEMIKN